MPTGPEDGVTLIFGVSCRARLVVVVVDVELSGTAGRDVVLALTCPLEQAVKPPASRISAARRVHRADPGAECVALATACERE
ncbi:MAG: hypothetical protein ACRD0Z_15405 [Acidimicrobiales bacterium]